MYVYVYESARSLEGLARNLATGLARNSRRLLVLLGAGLKALLSDFCHAMSIQRDVNPA